MTDKENRLAELVARQFAEMVATGGSGGGGGGGEGDVFLPDPAVYTYYKPEMTQPEIYRDSFLDANGAPIMFQEGSSNLPAVGDKICVVDVVTPDTIGLPVEPFAIWGTVIRINSTMFGPQVIIKPDGSTIQVNSAHEKTVTGDSNVFGRTKVVVKSYEKLAKLLANTGADPGSIDITDDDIPYGMRDLNTYALYSNGRLKTFRSTKITAASSYVFSQDTYLTDLYLPNITSISSALCQRCTRLTSAEFGNVTNISSNAFSGCTVLADLIFHSTAVPSLTSTALTNVPTTCNIWFPDAIVDAVKANSSWSSRASQIKPLSEKPTT